MPIRIALRVAPAVVREPAALVARGSFQNTERSTIRFNSTAISSATLALEVRDSHGTNVPLGKPPMPPLSDTYVDLKPAAKYPVTYTRFLPTSLPSGDYQLRLHYRDVSADIHSDWRTFKVRR